jgi:hypothetical protein
MTQTTAAIRRQRRRAAGRLLLSLLLLLAPVLTAAAGVPMMVAANAGATTAPAQMPCHPNAQPMQTVETGQQDACPHCTGDAPASQCHCCGYAAPAGLSVPTGISPDQHPGGAAPRLATTDPLPKTQGDRLYRPPIAHS